MPKMQPGHGSNMIHPNYNQRKEITPMCVIKVMIKTVILQLSNSVEY